MEIPFKVETIGCMLIELMIWWITNSCISTHFVKLQADVQKYSVRDERNQWDVVVITSRLLLIQIQFESIDKTFKKVAEIWNLVETKPRTVQLGLYAKVIIVLLKCCRTAINRATSNL